MVDAWQPIETAPKDASLVDLWTFNGRVPSAVWRRGHWMVWDRDCFESPGWARVQDKPTHWMPLPAPPEM